MVSEQDIERILVNRARISEPELQKMFVEYLNERLFFWEIAKKPDLTSKSAKNNES